MYAELERKCNCCDKPHPSKMLFCKRCLETRSKYRKANPEMILGIKLKHKYGISLDRYNEMVAAQSGVCMICGKINNRINYKTGKPERLVVDHNHATNEVRGLLCHRCNLAVGMYETMRIGIANYLEKFKN